MQKVQQRDGQKDSNLSSPAATAQLYGMQHIGLKTADLSATLRFYCDLLGMTEAWRPPFDYPGAWLVTDAPHNKNILIHVYAGDAARDSSGKIPRGSSAIDHIAIGASGFQAMKARLKQSGLPWRQHIPPNTQIWQLFAHDPNGVMIELNFDGAKEEGVPPDPKNGPWYKAGEDFAVIK